MITISFGNRGSSGPIKAPLSMPARMFLELQRHGFGHTEHGNGTISLPAGIRITSEPAPPLASVAGIFYRLAHHPAHLAGHYPHSRKTPEHVIEVQSDEMLGRMCDIFKRWPRVQVVRAQNQSPTC